MQNKNELEYLRLIKLIMNEGRDRPDRTGVGTRSIFGLHSRYDLSEGFPLLTTKKMDLRSVSSELIWFLEGSDDERRLAEIRYGKPREELTKKTTIWTANAEADYWKPKARFEGDCGAIYGVNLRRWKTIKNDGCVEEIDQVYALIEGLKKDPYSRRHILQMWNPGRLDEVALPACHMSAGFYVQDDKLSCAYVSRSQDFLLGRPYNDASYALLLHMIAHVCGYGVGDLIAMIQDAHIYSNHFEAVTEQLGREPRSAPKLKINRNVESIFDFKMEDFEIDGYDPHPMIKAQMAV